MSLYVAVQEVAHLDRVQFIKLMKSIYTRMFKAVAYKLSIRCTELYKYEISIGS